MKNGAMATILLVEDDAVLCETLRYNLEREGYDTLATDNGASGLQLARSSRPDLVILDVMLPDLDGFRSAASCVTKARSQS